MRLLLINPKINFQSVDHKFNDFIKTRLSYSSSKVPSLALLEIAALTPPDVEVEYVDENSQDIDFDYGADLVGIGLMTPQAPRAYMIAKEFSSRGAKVVLGGVHPTVLPDEVKEHADAIVIGEAERVWEHVVSDFRTGKLKDLYHGGIADLQKAPVPRYDIIMDAHVTHEPFSTIPMEFSRGCPRDCSFCSVTPLYGQKSRMKSASQIMREIESIRSHCQFDNVIIKFIDANPFVNKTTSKEMLQVLASAGIRWNSLADISIANDSTLLDLLREAGCFLVAVGFESLDPDELREFSKWKKGYVQRYVESVRTINDHGIVVVGNFMIGFGKYTRETIQRMRDFVIENRVLCQYTIATPYPGTRFYEEIKKDGRLKEELGWDLYNAFNVVHKTEVPAEKIYEDILWLYDKTWSPEVLQEIHKSNEQILKSKGV